MGGASVPPGDRAAAATLPRRARFGASSALVDAHELHGQVGQRAAKATANVALPSTMT
jgi:hypothetical protein